MRAGIQDPNPDRVDVTIHEITAGYTTATVELVCDGDREHIQVEFSTVDRATVQTMQIAALQTALDIAERKTALLRSVLSEKRAQLS